nr:hypothetical protein HK105_008127 [Polyrhizophydium stewartii]
MVKRSPSFLLGLRKSPSVNRSLPHVSDAEDKPAAGHGHSRLAHGFTAPPSATQTPPTEVGSLEPSRTPKNLRRRQSITDTASHIMQRVRRLSVTASTQLPSSDSKGRLLNQLGGQSHSIADRLEHSASVHASPGPTSPEVSVPTSPIDPQPAPIQDSPDAAIKEILSDHTVAILLGALCQNLFEFLEDLQPSDISLSPEQPAALADAVSHPVMTITEASEASGDSESALDNARPLSVEPQRVSEDQASLGNNPEADQRVSEDMPPNSANSDISGSTAAGVAQLAPPELAPKGLAKASSFSVDAAPESDGKRFALLANDVSAVRSAISPIDFAALPEHKQALWCEIEPLLYAVQHICQLHIEVLKTKVAAGEINLGSMDLDDILSMNPDKAAAAPGSEELGKVVIAIDRLLKLAPRLDGQSVLLTETKLRDLSAAQLIGMIERLNRGAEHYQAQRAQPASKYLTLNVLVEKISQSAKRRLDNQCFVMSPDYSLKLDMGRISGLLEQTEKRRYANQDWVSKEQRMLDDLTDLQNKLTSEEHRMQNQRFVMSPEKQRSMFFGRLSGHIERGQERRMQNQDAMSRQDIKEERFQEIDRIMDKMGGFDMASQRASVSSPRLSSVLKIKQTPSAP